VTNPTLTLRRATPDDAEVYATTAAATFVESYAATTPPEEMAAHLARAFGVAQQRQELADPTRAVFALVDPAGRWVGFAAVAATPSPPCVSGARPLQVERIYVRAASHGRGHGRTLLAAVDAEAARRGADVLWLQVWEHNLAAHAFYARLGWTRAGTHPFLMGTRYEDDWVLVRRVAATQSADPMMMPPTAPGPPAQTTAPSAG